MKAIYRPNFEIPLQAIAPDFYREASDIFPPEDMVISRGRDGTIVSFFVHMTWDLSPYHPDQRPASLSFLYWLPFDESNEKIAIIQESKLLLFSLMWMRNGRPLSIGTLQNYNSIIKALAVYSLENGLSLKDMICNERQLWNFIQKSGGWTIQTLGSMLTHIKNLEKIIAKYGFKIIDNRMLQSIRTIGSKYRDTLKQHPPIPTRIYSHFITELANSLRDWDRYEEELFRILHICTKNPSLGRSKEQQRCISRKLGTEFLEQSTFSELASSEIISYLKPPTRSADVRHLSAKIAEIQLVCILTIQLFTGMREDEAISLPYDCLEEASTNGITHIVLRGRTTKFNNGQAKEARWVTNSDGQRAVNTAKRIASTIYRICAMEEDNTKQPLNLPLFIGVGYLGLAGEKILPDNGLYRSTRIELGRMRHLRNRLEIPIQEDDLLELELIDPIRAWRSEENFQIDHPWRFTSHQFRRSLALYAQRSGLVSLPSLRRQLQHITDEMAIYYSRGSIFAKNFLGEDKQHFGYFWQETKAESEALSYISNVVLSDDNLFGGHASWLKQKIPDPVISFDRSETIRQFKNGEIAYQETVFGGCTRVGSCKHAPTKWLNTECLKDGCEYLVCNLKKLNNVIAAQETLVNELESESPEYRLEKNDLDVLLKFRKNSLSTLKA